MTRNIIIVLAMSFLISSPLAAAGVDESSTSSSDPRYIEAKRAINSSRFDQALPLLQQVVVAFPDDPNTWNYLGYSLRKLGRFDRALAAYKKALAINPDHLGANEYIGELYIETKQMDLARQHLKNLDRICFFGCEAYDDLKEAIAKAGG